ncbi:MAG: hypothetical protein EB150_08805 [Nitrososphaeria archaeon]|nr:hypothetical protein [Nitrososphaeria archaeon]NDB51670.1 hypothetical protein [Nitrosopumilaceae archaeon]NDB88196.1 hypothetical protein [Nitrososphaerota archaeon]NDB47383.1 hypothetical protein [Nitrososphaeria archaeon]NDB90125.1 hypothetical protein [Nitrososphaerota archaeon]
MTKMIVAVIALVTFLLGTIVEYSIVEPLIKVGTSIPCPESGPGLEACSSTKTALVATPYIGVLGGLVGVLKKLRIV